MRTKILNELKSSFEPYAPFWDEWKKYRGHGLSTDEIFIIELQLENDFHLDITELDMFSNHQELLARLLDKLKRNYPWFQDWLIRRFQFEIISLADGVPLDLYLTTPVKLFYSVPSQYRLISDELVTTLLKFNCVTLHDIFSQHSGTGFKTAPAFKIVTEFQTIIKIQKTIHQTLRKEVMKNRKPNCSLN